MARSRKTGEIVQAWPGGFPGPAAHGICYTRLKERGLETIPGTLGISGSRTERVVYIAGRRRAESKRRATIPHRESRGTVEWLAPIAVWHKADLRAYRLLHGDVPVNPVAQKLGMSGECGCGANGAPGERERWFTEFPNDPWLQHILDLEAEIADRPDIAEHRKRWQWGATYDDGAPRTDAGMLCGPDCGTDPLLNLMDPLFEVGAR
jgi:3'-phosphoadenosine 5'-phosphosulfate sulfotransferase (PAPS reductase)/FAD synthetase